MINGSSEKCSIKENDNEMRFEDDIILSIVFDGLEKRR